VSKAKGLNPWKSEILHPAFSGTQNGVLSLFSTLSTVSTVRVKIWQWATGKSIFPLIFHGKYYILSSKIFEVGKWKTEGEK